MTRSAVVAFLVLHTTVVWSAFALRIDQFPLSWAPMYSKHRGDAAGDDKPLEVVIQEERKARSLDQNALMWAGPLREIAEQAWVDGQQFSAEVWHEHFKLEFLPDESALGAEDLAARVKNPATWRKWRYTPAGVRVLVGSTTELSKFGFSEYLTQVEAYGASLGVQFSARMAK